MSVVNPVNVHAFITGHGPVTNSARNRFFTLNKFYRFALSRGYVQRSSMPTTAPKMTKLYVPYIYSLEEMRRILAGTASYKKFKTKALPDFILRPLIILLYSTGLRISEALSLTCEDVDLAARLLTIKNSKFYKTRLVPVGPKLTSELEDYFTKIRKTFPFPKGKDSAFFARRKGTPFHSITVTCVFRELCDSVGVRRNDGAACQPCIRDLRHTFATQRILSWYREGADVQRLLPLLSTYMGHVNIVSTQYYLKIIPALLQEASARFENYAQQEARHDQ